MSVILEASDDPLLIDRYIVLDTLGVGGMGVVYKALHKSMDRIVALKLLPTQAVDSPEKVERFKREAKAAARLSHPNIVTVHDSGASNGSHFLAMEYVAGPDLSSIILKQGPLSVGQSIRIVRDAALGLQHAHEQGIVHRDIKPANLLLTPESTVKVADLGLASVESMRSAAGHSSHVTEDGMILGTIAFLSPERALDVQTADARSDIYGLGATLFCLLTGRPPFNEETAMKTLVAHREQPVPSLRELREDVPEELDDICQKMLAKRPDDRFSSMQVVVAALGEIPIDDSDEAELSNVQVPLTGDTTPVARADELTVTVPEPCRESVRNLGNFGRRVMLSLCGAAIVLAGIIIVIKNKDGSETRIDGGDVESITLKTDEGELKIEIDGKKLAITPPENGGSTRTPDIWKPGPVDEVLPGLVASPEKRPGIRRWQIEMRNSGARINSLAWHPDGALVACGTSHGEIRLLDAESLEIVRYLPGHRRGVTCVAWNRHGVLASLSRDGTVRLWNADGMQGPVLQGLEGRADHLSSVVWSHSGEWLASPGEQGAVRLWKSDGTPGPVLDGHSETALCAAFSPDDQLIATGGMDGEIRLWNLDGTPGRVIKDERGSVCEIVWIDGEQFEATARDTLRVWKSDGTPGPSFEGHSGIIYDVDLSPNGRQIVSVGQDRTLRLWLPDGSVQSKNHAPNLLRAVAWSPDSRRVLSYCYDGGLRIHSGTGKLLKKVTLDGSRWPYSAAVSPDGAVVASGFGDGVIRLIGGDGTDQTALSEHSDRVESIAWSPDSSHFASASADRTVRIWKKDGTAGTVLKGHTGTIIKVAWSPDGQWLATGSNDKSVRLWQRDASPGPVFNGHTDAVFAVAWSPDSRQIVSASLDRSARVWNVDGEAGPVIASAGKSLLAIDWSPDGKQIATGSTDGFIRVYPSDGKTPKPLSINPKTSTYCNDVEWNHNGSLLASAHGDASVRLWNPDGSPAGKVQTRGEAKALNWSADGQRIAIANFARTVSLYDAETRQPIWTAVPLNEGKTAILSPNGQLLHGDSETLEDKLVYIVEHDDGRLETLNPSDFDKHTTAAKEIPPTESDATRRNH